MLISFYTANWQLYCVNLRAGMHEEKALICDAMSVAVRQYDQLEHYGEEDHLPLTALSMYRDFLDELAISL